MRSEVNLVPTMNLRFIKRKSANYPGETGYKFILQQQWVDSNGSGATKWQDVPRVDPSVRMEHHDA